MNANINFKKQILITLLLIIIIMIVYTLITDFKLSSILYRMGLLMITYDMVGHGLCLLARLTGNKGAILWNSYSKYVFPSLRNSIEYDLFWTLWFSIALIFIVQYK